MMVDIKFAALKDVKLHEYAVRFIFGGLCTVAAGLIAKRWGPGIGGLFLAFPAIFPAGASLIEKHQTKEKEEFGLRVGNRGRAAASVDAAGASIGCIGLLGFALVLWSGLPGHNPYPVVLFASITWFVLSLTFWLFRKKRILRGSLWDNKVDSTFRQLVQGSPSRGADPPIASVPERC